MSIPSWLRSALLLAHPVIWKLSRLTLIAWGMLNGFGLGLLGKVGQVKSRISCRVARVSGSATI